MLQSAMSPNISDYDYDSEYSKDMAEQEMAVPVRIQEQKPANKVSKIKPKVVPNLKMV